MCWLQPLKCEDLIIFFVIHDSKHECLWVLDYWSDKTRHLKMSPWALGKLKTAIFHFFFFFFWHFVLKEINREYNLQING